MLTADFDYPLPPELIAQHPAPIRTASRLMVLHRSPPSLQPTVFERLPDFLRAGDVLVLNNSKVLPARLRGVRPEGGARVELLLLEPDPKAGWWALLRPGKRLRIGARIQLPIAPGPPIEVRVMEKNEAGHCRVLFPSHIDPVEYAFAFGELPLPPYIERVTQDPVDRERYQTVYARESGSVAAPTAGLHFSGELLGQLARLGVQQCELTLHVGVGTFAPVKTARLADHAMHSERFCLPADSADRINQARAEGRRVIAVGTTSLRVLESVGREHGGRLVPGNGRTRLFLHPPAEFRVVDGLLTNFHLPRSTLLMLVSAFATPGACAGRARVLDAYRLAVQLGFRFFSYGDAMLLL